MGYVELRMYAEIYQDALDYRESTMNKLRSGTVGDSAARLTEAMKLFTEVEHAMSLEIRRVMRRTVSPSIKAWQKSQPGIGEHLFARLMGELGDPYIAQPYHWVGKGENRVLVADPPHVRTLSQLWSYCGVGDPKRKVFKGITAEELAAMGKPKAKMLLHLLSEACVKAGVRVVEGTDREDGQRKAITKYGQVYLDARERYATRTHDSECKRCGPSGKPALPGSPLSKGHQHAAALRKVGKEILRDLWLAAREDALNESEDLQDKFGGASGKAKPIDRAPRQSIDDDTVQAV